MPELVRLPFNQRCHIIAHVRAGYRQRITVKDLERNTVVGKWEGQGDGAGEVGRVVIHTDKRGPDSEGYRVEVTIESSADNGATWGTSRTRIVRGGGDAWTLYTVQSEDIGSSDNDWNDATVHFNFPGV